MIKIDNNKIYKVRAHAHPLLPQYGLGTWVCKGSVMLVGGCRSGVNSEKHSAIKRWRCEQCNFILCRKCLSNNLNNGKDGIDDEGS